MTVETVDRRRRKKKEERERRKVERERDKTQSHAETHTERDEIAYVHYVCTYKNQYVSARQNPCLC